MQSGCRGSWLHSNDRRDIPDSPRVPRPRLHWFTEGFDTQDLKDAKARLGELE